MFGGAKKSKHHFRPIFSPFQAILNNFDFLSFLTNIFLYGQQFYFFWGVGLKSSKIIFDQFSRHFRQFWTTLIFFIFDQKMLSGQQIFFGGGGGRTLPVTKLWTVMNSSIPLICQKLNLTLSKLTEIRRSCETITTNQDTSRLETKKV